MDIQISEDGSNATIAGGLGNSYNSLREQIDRAEAAAKENDAESVHAAHNLILAAAITMSQVSYFGLAVKKINEASEKIKAEQADKS